MKRYIKDGIIKTRNQIVIKGQRTIKDKDGNEKVVNTNTFNPKHEDIIADGWEEYVVPELTDIQKMDRAKENKKREIEHYDSSSEVNEFTINGINVWLDKATRAGLMLRFQAEQAMGEANTTLWYNGTQFPLTLTDAVSLLYAIERYASACYDNTQKHLSNVENLSTIEEIENYDYRSGYPEKLRIDE
jgi:hypothetical protein